MSAPAVGLAAALGAPALSALGCLLWDRYWAGSAFALNLFKCAFATILFAVTVGADGRSSLPSKGSVVPWLCFSSLLGIIVGDLAWLASMRLLGARRVILVDSLKPFLAAILGGALGERLTPIAAGAMVLSVLGILAVALERTTGTVAEIESVGTRARGFALAIANVCFDVVGAVITKRFAVELGPWEIGLCRFGFAALVMTIVALGAAVHAALRRSTVTGPRSEEAQTEASGGPADVQLRPSAQQEVEAVAPVPEVLVNGLDGDGNGDGGEKARPKVATEVLLDPTSASPARAASARWHGMPRGMGVRAWASVSFGVMLVTFLAVGLGNVALFRLPLGLFLTLQSLGPIYALPIALVVKREVASTRAWAGSIVAVVGVALFSHETFKDDR